MSSELSITPRIPSIFPSTARSPRIQSRVATATTAPIGISMRRTEKVETYKAVANQEPWGIRVRSDVEHFLEEQKQKAQQEREKRERFRIGLEAQLKEHAEQKKREEKQKAEEANRESELFHNYRKLQEEEKKQKKARHLAEIHDRLEITKLTQTMRDKAYQEELEAAKNYRAINDGMWEKAQASESARRQRQKKLMEEMLVVNEQIKHHKQEEILKEYDLDRQCYLDQVRREDAARAQRQELVARRTQAVSQNIGLWEAVKADEEARQRRMEEKIEAERQALLVKGETEHLEQLNKRKDLTKKTKSFLVLQMEEREKRRQEREKEERLERQRLDADTAKFYDEIRNKKTRNRQRNLLYGQNLHEQMDQSHRKAIEEIISPPRLR